MARQDAAEDLERPALQGLRQQRVVGIRKRLASHAPRVDPRHGVLIDQQAHELRNRDRRMGVVQLHRKLFVELGDRQFLRAQDAEHVLQRAGDEEILLFEAQLLAAQLLVVRIEDLAEVLRDDLLVDGAVVIAAVEAGEVEGFRRLGAPQAQRIRGVAVIAENESVVRHSIDDFVRHPAHAQPLVLVDVLLRAAAEFDAHGPFGPDELPRVAEAQPPVGFLDLPAVDDLLVEYAELVANAVAERGYFERGEGVDEAGRQASEAAAAEARLLFLVQQLLEVHAELGHALPDRFEYAEIDEVVAEVRTQEEFRGEIRDGARAVLGVRRRRADPALQHAIAHGVGERHVVVVLGGERRELALHVEQAVQERVLDGLFRQAGALVLELPHGAQNTSTGVRCWRSTARTGISSTGPSSHALR